MFQAFRYLFFVGVGIIFFILSYKQAETAPKAPSKRKQTYLYKTSFGECPSRVAGGLALKLMKTFEQTGSLKDVKRKMTKERLNEKHFLSDYKINFNPLEKLVHFKFSCPKPLMKVQIYKEGEIDFYEAILVDNGQLFDPTYEVLLRTEKKLKGTLPFLALPVGEVDKDLPKRIVKIIKKMSPKVRKRLAEVVLDKKSQLTIILSVNGHPSSAFFGPLDWEEKVEKLERIIAAMETSKKVPAIINLTNAKKVVVKFSDKF